MESNYQFTGPAGQVSVLRACALAQVSKSTFYRRQKDDPDFPRIRKSGRRSFVLLLELQAWMHSLPALYSISMDDHDSGHDEVEELEEKFIGAFRALRYKHSAARHEELLRLLESPAMPSMFQILCLAASGRQGDFDYFCDEIRRQAASAMKNGLVVKGTHHG
ncbi:MAG: hypothetical protein U1F55_14905 [Chitinivorax sp.]